MGQGQHGAHAAATALAAVFHIAGDFMDTGIPLDAVGRQNQNSIGGHLHLVLQH